MIDFVFWTIMVTVAVLGIYYGLPDGFKDKVKAWL